MDAIHFYSSLNSSGIKHFVIRETKSKWPIMNVSTRNYFLGTRFKCYSVKCGHHHCYLMLRVSAMVKKNITMSHF